MKQRPDRFVVGYSRPGEVVYGRRGDHSGYVEPMTLSEAEERRKAMREPETVAIFELVSRPPREF